MAEKGITALLFTAASISLLTTFGIIYVLISESLPFFRQVPLFDFLTGTRWAPQFANPTFGVLPLVAGTTHIVVGSALLGLPLGLLTAIFLSEYAGFRIRSVLKPFLEILAGIPTIVYGYFALTFITPWLRYFFGDSVSIFNALSGAIVVGVMILPTVASLCEDALSAVPRSLRDGAYALGATKLEVTTRIVVPSALSGILAAFILAISRAIGETMAVKLAAGSFPNLTINPLESIQTMTAFIVDVSKGDNPRGSISYYSIYAVGLLLFLITLGLNIISNKIMKKFQEQYE